MPYPEPSGYMTLSERVVKSDMVTKKTSWWCKFYKKHNRQINTFIQTAATVAALAFCDVVLGAFEGGAIPTDFNALFYVAGATALSAAMQYIRGKLSTDDSN